MQIGEAVDVASVRDELGFIFYFQFHEIGKSHFFQLVCLFQNFHFFHVLSHRHQDVVVIIVHASYLVTERAFSYLAYHFDVLLCDYLHHYAVRVCQYLIEIINHRFVHSDLALIFRSPMFHLVDVSTNGQVFLL